MTFGRRFSIHYKPVAPLVKQICMRCLGSCRVLERGQDIACRVCGGTGKVVAVAKRAS